MKGLGEVAFKETANELAEELKTIDPGLIGEKAAYLSKELATIKTDIDAYKLLKLDDLHVNLDKEKTRNKFRELEFKSLVEKL